jgi:hypothetical protein
VPQPVAMGVQFPAHAIDRRSITAQQERIHLLANG